MSAPKVGDQLDMWFSGGVVVNVRPYTGRYPQWFTLFVSVTAIDTVNGTMEFAW